LVKNAFRDLNVEEYYASTNGAQLELDVVQKRAFAGIQFDDAWANLADHIPDDFHFALRFPSITRQEKKTWLTRNMFPSIQLRGQQNYYAPGYYQEGFLALQQRLSLEYIREKSGLSELPRVMVEHFPYPAYTKNEFLPFLTFILPSFIILSFLYPFMCVTKVSFCTRINVNYPVFIHLLSQFIAAEKEKQLKEVMKIMGLRNWLHWTAWFVKTFIPLTISAITVTTALKVDTKYGAVLENASLTVVLFFLIVYIIASICFCFMMATLFSKASTAATVTSFIWLIAHIPYFLRLDGLLQVLAGLALVGREVLPEDGVVDVAAAIEPQGRSQLDQLGGVALRLGLLQLLLGGI